MMTANVCQSRCVSTLSHRLLSILRVLFRFLRWANEINHNFIIDYEHHLCVIALICYWNVACKVQQYIEWRPSKAHNIVTTITIINVKERTKDKKWSNIHSFVVRFCSNYHRKKCVTLYVCFLLLFLYYKIFGLVAVIELAYSHSDSLSDSLIFSGFFFSKFSQPKLAERSRWSSFTNTWQNSARKKGRERKTYAHIITNQWKEGRMQNSEIDAERERREKKQ